MSQVRYRIVLEVEYDDDEHYSIRNIDWEDRLDINPDECDDCGEKHSEVTVTKFEVIPPELVDHTEPEPEDEDEEPEDPPDSEPEPVQDKSGWIIEDKGGQD